MPRKIFVDTGYALALFNIADEFHKRARELKGLTLRPNFVQAEFRALLLRGK